MGLDLVPLGRPKPGHEVEWAKLMQTLYNGKPEREKAATRRNDISVHPYESVGAPRVGHDAEADAWALARKDPDKGLSDAEVLERLRGYYVLELVSGKCDGVPEYTHGGLYRGVDETSFRGAFLTACEDLLGEALLSEAWTDVMRPEEAVGYGKRLLIVAGSAEAANARAGQPSQSAKPWRRSEDGQTEYASEDEITVVEKIDILRAAGRWYVFWGERGHPISAWF